MKSPPPANNLVMDDGGGPKISKGPEAEKAKTNEHMGPGPEEEYAAVRERPTKCSN